MKVHDFYERSNKRSKNLNWKWKMSKHIVKIAMTIFMTLMLKRHVLWAQLW